MNTIFIIAGIILILAIIFFSHAMEALRTDRCINKIGKILIFMGGLCTFIIYLFAMVALVVLVDIKNKENEPEPKYEPVKEQLYKQIK